MAVDFDTIRERIARAGDLLAGTDDPAKREALLARRRRDLATRRRRRDEVEIRHEVIAFERAGERYGVPILRAAEVRTVQLATLPGLPSAVAGLFQIRGSVHALVDLASFFGSSAPADRGPKDDRASHEDAVQALVVETDLGSLGLRLDALLGPLQLTADECSGGGEGRDTDFVADVGRDLLAVLDVDRLARRGEVRIEAAAGSSSFPSQLSNSTLSL